MAIFLEYLVQRFDLVFCLHRSLNVFNHFCGVGFSQRFEIPGERPASHITKQQHTSVEAGS